MTRFIISILLITLSSLFFPSFTQAKSYTIDSAQIDVQINPNGTADVSETRAYSFLGHFENGEWNLDVEKNKIDTKSIALFEGSQAYQLSAIPSAGSYSISTSNNKVTVKWKYSADDETRLFTIKYQVLNAITNYQDTAEFYWKFIGTGWSVPTHKVTAVVNLPYPAPDSHLKAWGHGPLNGTVAVISPTQIKFESSYLEPNTFFEGRIIMPPFAKIDIISQNQLEKIIAEESNFINQTIRSNKNPLSASVKYYLAVTIAILTIRAFYWASMWLKHGKETKTPPVNLSGTLHEPPSNLEPALVEALMSFDFRPKTNSITATVLELCRRKIIKLTQIKRDSFLGIIPQKPDILFEVTNNPTITTIEKDVLKLLFLDNNDSITKSQILSKIKADPFREIKWTAWRENVKKTLLNMGYLNKISHQLKSKILLDIIVSIVNIVIVGYFLSKVSIAELSSIYLIIGVFAGTLFFILFLIIIGITMDKKTQEGAEEVAKWKAFKKYLKDYSVTKNYPLESIIIWEKYLVYGSALGISLKALSQLPIDFSASANSSYIYAAAISDNGSLNLNSITSGFNSISASYGASGSGSSGGFSGGGGGGGGGSGGGMS